MSELEEIKRQHEKTMLRISVELERMTARRNITINTRQQLTECLQQDTSNLH